MGVYENGQLYFVRTDHIGRPVFATVGTGVKVWEATYGPFGGVTSTLGPNADLRFPGQWFQSETALHQNWMRDYDPTLGRYIQADPLGLVDGASVYGYALQNPGRYIDPRGEFVPFAFAAARYAALAYSAYNAYHFGKNLGEDFQKYGWMYWCYDWEGLAWNVAGAAGGGLAAHGFNKVAKPIVPLVVQNRNRGDAFRDEIADLLKRAGRDIETEVFFPTPFGKRFADIQVSKDGRILGLVETKTGNSRYTPSQRTKDFYFR